MKRDSRLKSAIFLFLFVSILAAGSRPATSEQPLPENREAEEAEDLLSKQSELRRLFLAENSEQSDQVRVRLGSAANDEEKNKITEEFRKNRLKRLEKFQAEDQVLTQQIKDARLKNK